jgi:hypothetical protein
LRIDDRNDDDADEIEVRRAIIYSKSSSVHQFGARIGNPARFQALG